jgi:hypothetical protein
MSKETLDLMMGLNQSELETQVALQCAPLLTGLKMSNLLIVAKHDRNNVIRLFRETAISCFLLYESEDKVTFLLYLKEKLEQYLEMGKVKKMMAAFGYSGMPLGVILRRISVKYSAHMREKMDFPHEIGLLLGYPTEDVSGFIKNGGKNFLYIGYWIVYSNLAECMKIFAGYDWAREKVIHLISGGMGVRGILNCYY